MRSLTVDHSPQQSSAKPAVVLAVACAAQLLVVLDGLIVNVALPQIRSGVAMSVPGQQWIVNSYLIAFGGLLLLAARAADLLGHRRIFLAGLVVFTLASLAGGLAQNATMLIAARVLQGAGAAALAPSSLSLLMATYTGEQRARALSFWSAASGSGAALGLVLGGVITDGLGWRWTLLINVPVGVLLGIVAFRALDRSRVPVRRRLDVGGAVTVTAAVTALTYGISQVEGRGWGSPWVLVPALAAMVLLGTFVAVERRSSDPLVPLRVVGRRDVLMANAVMAGLGAIMTGMLYFLSMFLQHVLGYSPLRTGLALVPMSVVMAAGAIASRPLSVRFGARRLITVGAVVMAAGLVWLSALSPDGHYAQQILGPTMLWAAGASIVTMPCVALATSAVEAGHTGLSSGLVNTARQVGGAVGLTILAAVAGAAATSGGPAPAIDQTVRGYSMALIVAAGVALLMAIGVQGIRRD